MLVRTPSASLQFAALIIIYNLSMSAASTLYARGRLRNYLYNTKCLRPLGLTNGAHFEVVDCSDSSTDQIIDISGFQNMEADADYVRFSVSGKCLSLSGFSSENGIRTLIWDCVDQVNQKWKVVNGNSRSTFQLQLLSTGKCITAERDGTIDQWDCIGTEVAPHQSWTLDVIESGGSGLGVPIRNDVTVLRNFAYNTKCLRAVTGENGAPLQVVDCSPRPDQLLRMEGLQDMQSQTGYLQFDANRKCVSLKGFDNENGVPILLWDCVNQDNQKWRIINGDLGNSFQLQLVETGKCLTAEREGTYLDQWDCLGSKLAPHQSWTIDKIRA